MEILLLVILGGLAVWFFLLREKNKTDSTPQVFPPKTDEVKEKELVDQAPLVKEPVPEPAPAPVIKPDTEQKVVIQSAKPKKTTKPKAPKAETTKTKPAVKTTKLKRTK